MANDMLFWHCDTCGAIYVVAADPTNALDSADYMLPNTVDAAKEKHIPVVEVDGDLVNISVGSIEHPMEEDHWITFILLQTSVGFQVAQLQPGDAPQASFALNGAKPLKAYEFCNKHGLWATEL